MSYNREIIDAAFSQLSHRRKIAIATQKANRSAAVAMVPEIAGLERELAQTAMDMVKTIGMGEDAEVFMRTLSKKNLDIQEKIRNLLEKNGFSRDYIDYKFTCSHCEDTGYVNGIPCQCLQNLCKSIALKTLGNNSRAAECSFGTFNAAYYSDEIDERFGISPRRRMEQVLRYCQCYAEDFDLNSESLYLYGATGLGKTHLTLAMACEITNRGFNIIYETAGNLLRKLEKEHFSSGKSNEYDGYEDAVLNCDLLIIDDLGSEFSTQFTVSAVYNIINTRLNCQKPIIISTNLDMRDLEQKYTERVASRILGNYRALLFLGKDIRQIKSTQ